MRKPIDFRSDTVTLPTNEMREVMYQADVGDDVYREDPTMNRLEVQAAEKVGKEAALFVPTGTMGNQLAVLTHTKRGDEIILEAAAHIYATEVGGIAVMAGVIPRLVSGRRGIMDPADITVAIRPANIHFAPTSLICVENTHNAGGGTVIPLEILAATKQIAAERNIALHMDGARVFNAAAALGVDVKEITQYADSVMFCLSKGLCAPVGSMLAGTAEYIERARKWRKMLGGGMRQAGFLAAAGIVALEKMTERLTEDHANARRLAEGLAAIPGINVDLEAVQTNIVFFDFGGAGVAPAAFAAALRRAGIITSIGGAARTRFVTHYGITEEDIDYTLEVIKRAAGGRK
ncbi:MAG: low-specificity L-threonine aldolase [bacterium]|jgi:threonine aldolase